MAESRSGSDKRRLTELVGIRLLPSEGGALEWHADREVHRSVQSWMRTVLEPYLRQSPVDGLPHQSDIHVDQSNVIDLHTRTTHNPRQLNRRTRKSPDGREFRSVNQRQVGGCTTVFRVSRGRKDQRCRTSARG